MKAENHTKIYHVLFPDKGAGSTKVVSYIEAESDADARKVAGSHPDFEMYDTDSGVVTHASDTFEGIKNGLLRNGPNTLYRSDGEKVTRSDLED